MLHVAVAGALGRMGREVVKAITNEQGVVMGPKLGRPQSDQIGTNAGKLAGVNSLLGPLEGAQEKFDVLIDFTVPAAALHFVSVCSDLEKPIVVGTTGFDDEGRERILHAAKKIPIVMTSNLSLTGNQLFRASEDAFRRLGGKDIDVEIIEVHHRDKLDAPSGTTLQLGRSLLSGFLRQDDSAEAAVCVRRKEYLDEEYGDKYEAVVQRVAQRNRSATEATEARVYALEPTSSGNGQDDFSITIVVYRIACPFLCWHNVRFSLPKADEWLDITCEVPSRAVFAQGALQAAKFLEDRPAGLYDMDDVLRS